MRDLRRGGARAIGAAGVVPRARLHAGDVDRAALEYERLRRILVKFFDWRGVWPPEDCADETLDRLRANDYIFILFAEDAAGVGQERYRYALRVRAR